MATAGRTAMAEARRPKAARLVCCGGSRAAAAAAAAASGLTLPPGDGVGSSSAAP